jgi:hypothetical protein
MKEALTLALEALEIADNIALVGVAYTPKSVDAGLGKIRAAITAIKEALAQPVQEPVAWMCDGEPYAVKQMRLSINGGGEHPNQVPLYTTPQQRPWVGLTDDEIYDSYNEPHSDSEMVAFAREVEVKLKEKNT